MQIYIVQPCENATAKTQPIMLAKRYFIIIVLGPSKWQGIPRGDNTYIRTWESMLIENRRQHRVDYIIYRVDGIIAAFLSVLVYYILVYMNMCLY